MAEPKEEHQLDQLLKRAAGLAARMQRRDLLACINLAIYLVEERRTGSGHGAAHRRPFNGF